MIPQNRGERNAERHSHDDENECRAAENVGEDFGQNEKISIVEEESVVGPGKRYEGVAEEEEEEDQEIEGREPTSGEELLDESEQLRGHAREELVNCAGAPAEELKTHPRHRQRKRHPRSGMDDFTDAILAVRLLWFEKGADGNSSPRAELCEGNNKKKGWWWWQ
jgi:hypothetical protein